MEETKYGKYIITEMEMPAEQQSWSAKYRPQDKIDLLHINDDVIKGAFYVQAGWFLPAITENKSPDRSTKPHAHTYDEIIGIFGTDTENPHDLCGEIEIWLEDEPQILTKSSLLFIPRGMMHCPLIIRRVDRPIFHTAMGTGGIYLQNLKNE